jgi:hypothetical protein
MPRWAGYIKMCLREIRCLRVETLDLEYIGGIFLSMTSEVCFKTLHIQVTYRYN